MMTDQTLVLAVIFGAMLVLLGTMLFQVKARLYMAESGGKTFTRASRFLRYFAITLIWAAITAGVFWFALTR